MAYLQPLLAGSSVIAVIAAGVVAFGKPPVPETGTEPAIAMTDDHEVVVREDAAGIVGEQNGPSGHIPEDSTSQHIRAQFPNDAARLVHNERTEAPLEIALREAYAKRIYDPIWSESGAHDLLSRLRRAEAAGMRLQPGLIERVEASADALDGSGRDRAAADVFLSRVFLAIADREHNGLDPEADLMPGGAAAPDPEPLDVQLAYAGEGAFDYAQLQPLHPEYRELIEARAVYAGYVAEGGFTPVPPPGEVLERGDNAPAIATLRRRLEDEGYVIDEPEQQSEPNAADASKAAPAAPPGRAFTEAVETALIEFQRRNGLERDGLLGPNTVEALNVTAQEKLDRIDANIERWRQAPADFGERYIRVNIPAFRAEAREAGETVLDMRAIVGMPTRETPVFSESIEYIIANPRWYVPENILSADKLDDIRSDPGYITSHDYYVLSRDTGEQVDPHTVDWTQPGVENHYRLVQRPGAGNALGTVKLMFPNDHSVYMHDTPGTHLFENDIRAFSSGCIRLARPHDMARWTMRAGGIPGEVGAIEAAWNNRDHTQFDLVEPVPVYIVYFTVEVEADGDILFHNDVYNRDEAVIHALASSETGPVGTRGA
ncbi:MULTISPECIES: L,D-transpeptidase family protein [Hyphobacterium]|uniref:Murein L,D-transpeptidase n=1 Tax=Hyphobacterium vulgare TaxID=1736751 RepID=A0ABV7A0G5_9PROT